MINSYIQMWENFMLRVQDFFHNTTDHSQYISISSRRYWLLKDYMDRMNGREG